jgi:AcrR family transcriptional regulator
MDDTRVPRQQDERGRSARARAALRHRRATRQAIVAAAHDLLKEGSVPTLAEAAKAAGVSRATAYRYFASQDELLLELSLLEENSPTEMARRWSSEHPGDPAAHLAFLARRMGEWSFEHEAILRSNLRIALESADYERPGHRREWIATGLAPLKERIDPTTFERLSSTLMFFFGLEPLLVLKDLAGLDRDQALDVIEWAVRTLTQAVADGEYGR